LSAPSVTIIQVDDDVVLVRIDKRRSSIHKPLPLEYYTSIKPNALPAPIAITTSTESTDIVSSSPPSAGGNSIKAISQVRMRIKKLFKPLVDIVNFFGGLFALVSRCHSHLF
jgi:hypothetical protein